MSKRLILSSLAAVCAASTFAGAFTNGNVAVIQADASANNTTFGVVEVNATAGGAVQTIAVNGASGPNALRVSGSATSTCYLSLTDDGSMLSFTGANTTTTTGNINTFLSRGVGTLDSTGSFALQTTYTGTNAQQTRAATSLDNANWIVGDQGGLYNNNAAAATFAGNYRKVHAFGGTVYGGTTSSVATNIVVGSITAPGATSYTGLNGLANNATMADFYMVQSGANGSAFDMLYVLDETSATAGTIEKWSLVGGTWTANGTSTETFGGFGLAARMESGKAALYASTGTGATTNNSLLKLIDAAGYNQTISLGTSTNLYTASGGAIVKGVDFTPAAVPEPASFAVVGLAIFGLLKRRRK